MDNKPAIEVRDISKSFRIPLDGGRNLKQRIVHFLKRTKGYREFSPLNDISFTVNKGDFYGIVGRNGSGKSTLLKTIAGIYNPEKGHVRVHGKLVPFIELGVGFNGDLTGRENVYLNGAMLGFSRRETAEMYDEIVDFAELHDFMEEELKNYSSGMQVRLAFSIAIRAKGDILLLDEVLAVGDASFQKKCYDYFLSLKEKKKTVVLVTHDMGAIKQYCNKVIMIEDGRITNTGKPEDVARAYTKQFNLNSNSRNSGSLAPTRWGEGGIVAQDVKISASDSDIEISVTYTIDSAKNAPMYGFTLYNQTGLNVFEANTQRSDYKTNAVKPGEVVTIIWKVPNILSQGRYKLSVACCDASATHFYDWLDEAASLTIDKELPTAGAVDPSVEIVKFEQGDK